MVALLDRLEAAESARDEALAAVERVRALADVWRQELTSGAIREEHARYCWGLAEREVRAALTPSAPTEESQA